MQNKRPLKGQKLGTDMGYALLILHILIFQHLFKIRAMGVVARATDGKLGANGVVFQPGFDGTTPAPPNPENSIIFFIYIFPIYFLYIYMVYMACI